MPNIVRVQIHHEKYNKLAKNCLTLKNVVDNHLKQIDLGGVICEKNT